MPHVLPAYLYALNKTTMNRLTIAVALLLTMSSNAQNIQLKLPAGKKFETTTTHYETQLAADAEIISTMLLVELYEIKSVKPAQIDMQATLLRLKRNYTGMGEDITDDTDEKNETDVMLKERFCKPRNIRVNAAGKPVDEASMDNAFKTDLMATGISLFYSSLIGRPLTKGASWKDSSVSISDQYNRKIKGTFTVRSVQDNTAVITFEGNLENGFMIELEENTSSSIEKSKITGEIKMDLETGIVLESTTSGEGTTIVEANGKAITSVSKSTTTIKTKML